MKLFSLARLCGLVISALIGTILGAVILGPMILGSYFGFDHGYGESERSVAAGGLAGGIAGAVIGLLSGRNRKLES